MLDIRLFIGHSFINAEGVKMQWTKTQVRQVVKQLVKTHKDIEGFTLMQGNLGSWHGVCEMSSCLEFIVENDNDLLLTAIADLRDELKHALIQESIMVVTTECEVSF